jgi:hypothetical protein
MQNHAPTIYAYNSVEALLEGEDRGGNKSQLPQASGNPVTERPDVGVGREILHDLPGQSTSARTT